jgi:hypothetical protein
MMFELVSAFRSSANAGAVADNKEIKPKTATELRNIRNTPVSKKFVKTWAQINSKTSQNGLSQPKGPDKISSLANSVPKKKTPDFLGTNTRSKLGAPRVKTHRIRKKNLAPSKTHCIHKKNLVP